MANENMNIIGAGKNGTSCAENQEKPYCTTFFKAVCIKCRDVLCGTGTMLKEAKWSADDNWNWYCKKCGHDVFWEKFFEPLKLLAFAANEITRLANLETKIREEESRKAIVEISKTNVCCGTCFYFRRESQSCTLVGKCDTEYSLWESKYKDRTSCAQEPAQNTMEICHTAPNSASIQNAQLALEL